ncbi:hypothetical protein Avbf_14292 [Armadillidium vulgare]|nr:hypothetical protein Avbf_14292 [Armadillidium vulgare]
MKIFLSFVLLCAIVGTQAFYIEDGSQESGEKYDLFEIPNIFGDEDNEVLVLNPSEDISDEDSDEDFGSLVRTKRQVANQAMDLALSHQGRNGNDRPVGQLPRKSRSKRSWEGRPKLSRPWGTRCWCCSVEK